ncbi:hypothetical protein AB205_0167680 [Aquarana catesbeiana]|uniref:Thioredoxin domain-containing protein n=1 Tax=Aquarana catesbeiana TaxID=8400 RepID=A0A2G9RYZ5_AQUCT|nr:hypothetical protein AB205_0167680 [Aquarana catesbeiana]PIO33016.1 hypothetical protein AB205_0167680 [Aquarana catesbeiana]
MPDVLFIKIEVGKDDEYTKRFKIKGVPAFFYFKNGCEVGSIAVTILNHIKLKDVQQLRNYCTGLQRLHLQLGPGVPPP